MTYIDVQALSQTFKKSSIAFVGVNQHTKDILQGILDIPEATLPL